MGIPEPSQDKPSYDDVVAQFTELQRLHQRTVKTMKDKLARSDWFFERIACIPNGKLDAVTKMVTLGISQEYVRKGLHHSEFMKLWYPNVVDYTGLSEQTVIGGVSKLHKVKALYKEKKYDKVKRKSHVWVAFTPEFLVNPASLFVDVQESGHGGTRVKKHKGCGGEIVNLCTLCGETHIPNSEIYYEDTGQQERNDSELAAMDEYIEATDNYYEAADIPDDVVATIGVQQVMTATPRQIAEIMSQPRHIREGLCDEDMEALYAISQEWKGKQ